MSAKDLILVLGTGRSGTSALTRVLSLCGCTLPRLVFAPGSEGWNPKGFWESAEAVRLNLEFLVRHHNTLGGPGMWVQAEAVIEENEKEEFVNRVRRFLSSCDDGPLVIKAEGLVSLIEFWLEGARREALSPKIVIPVRHPGEVFASSSAAFGERAIEARGVEWLETYLKAEHHSRQFRRVFVEYSNLVHDWRSEVSRISRALAINLQTEGTRVDEFLCRDLYRQRAAGPVLETFGSSWVSEIYNALLVAAEDGPVDVVKFDHVYNAYRACARTFRIAIDEYRASLSRSQDALRRVESWPVWTMGQDF